MSQFTFESRRRNLRLLAAVLAVVLAAALLGFAPASSEPVRKSGYAIGTESCGSGDLAFPRIQLDMKAGFCAGLVASEEDRLKFPRSIVQVPGRDLFVVAAWAAGVMPTGGCSCSIRMHPRGNASRSC